MRSAVLLALSALILLPSTAPGQTNDQGKIQPHLVTAGGANPCSPASALVPCSGIVTSGDVSPALYYAYILVTDGSVARGVAGAQFGIDYDGAAGSGIDVFSWTRCADLDFPGTGWPAPGSGNTVTWDPDGNCQGTRPGGAGTGVVAATGYFYLASYGPDALSVRVHPSTGQAKLADCDAVESILPGTALGTARFSEGGTLPGYNPCTGTGSTDPSCAITGPDPVLEGTTHSYSVAFSTPPLSMEWRISGNGTITGSTTGNSVTVIAGTVGTFTISVRFTTPVGTFLCFRTIEVDDYLVTCSISGPNALAEGMHGTYTVASNPPAESWLWSVDGDALTTTPLNDPSLILRAGRAGTLTVRVTVTVGSSSTECSMIVSVFSPEPEGPTQGNAKIVVHLGAPTTKIPCTSVRPICETMRTNGGLYPPNLYNAYILVADGYTSGAPRSGVAGAQFGVAYDAGTGSGIDIFAWTLCATLEFPSTGWPEAGGGNLITWDPVNQCQATEPGGQTTGVVTPLGLFYMAAYSEDELIITPRPVDGVAKVANCFAAESILTGSPSPLGIARFTAGGLSPGYNPCHLATPVVNTTWGRIKSLDYDR